MSINDKELRLFPSDQESSAQAAPELRDALSADVRSAVETQFQQMQKLHDRIRAEELAARLEADTIN